MFVEVLLVPPLKPVLFSTRTNRFVAEFVDQDHDPDQDQQPAKVLEKYHRDSLMGNGARYRAAAACLGHEPRCGPGFFVDGQQLGKPAQIVAAIVAFAIIGKVADWIIVLAAAPFLRWEDRFGAQADAD